MLSHNKNWHQLYFSVQWVGETMPKGYTPIYGMEKKNHFLTQKYFLKR